MIKPASLLVIDDKPTNLEVIESLLSDEDYDIHYASSGPKALERLDSIKPDVILLDVMMPEMDGMEVCRRIKANSSWCHIPIIMVTILDAKEDLARCMDAGADDFISKPVNGIELRARVRSMLRMKQQYDRVQSLLEMREDMVNMMVHDLRNPLSNILLSCGILQRNKFDENRKKKVIEQMLFSVNRLQSHIDTLLLLAKLESAKMVLNLVDEEVSLLARKVISNFLMLAEHKKINLTLDVPEKTYYIPVDIPIFMRILENLLANAIKFSPPHSEITIKIEYPETLSETESVSPKLRIQVIDEGPGVSPELQARIFEKYEIGDREASAQPNRVTGVKQTGLGLAFCKTAVEAHNGKIFVENRPSPSKGAIFAIEI
jgi:two-component system sensor histidine kinase/response regulator